MSVDNVINAGKLGDARSGHALRFDADDAFGGRLQIGEVLQGKVVQHFDGSRYAVSFGGTEKIVDSALPLTRGELIYGRVVGLNDKVHLQRVFPGQAQTVRGPGMPAGRSGNQAVLQDLFAQYHAKLPSSLEALVLPQMKAHPTPALVALSSLILSKLGLQAETTLVRSVTRILVGERQAIDAESHKASPVLNADNERILKPDPRLISELASILALLSDPRATQLAPDSVPGEEGTVDGCGQENIQADPHEGSGGQGKQHRDGGEQLGYWLLNAQNDGSVSHRLARLPIWFGERLVEVDVAMFSQGSTLEGENVRHRKIVLSLQTEGLGRVEVSVYAADRRLRLHFATDSELASDVLAAHFGDIRSAVDTLGWVVDEVSYVVLPQSPDGLMQSVAEHYITNDSLNRVM